MKTTQAPFGEDSWEWIQIGQAVFRSLSPCYRCIFPNINPQSSERNKDNEPMKTLKSYRSWGISQFPRFGIQMGIRKEGMLKKGDAVYIEE